MLKSLLCLLLALSACLGQPAPRAALGMKTGVLVRMHVIAQDDTPAMQAVKAPVRDAVRAAYAAHADRASGATMLTQARALLPDLTRAARDAAQAVGFTGDVTVTVGQLPFDTRELDGLTIPEGVYPALVVRLGRAEGRNWWGLLDPEAALAAAALPGDAEDVIWDWSLAGLWAALTHFPFLESR